ncbi:mitochondrial ribosomal protein S27 (predicted), isoform CRA_f [Rattus norvegicus]|uniref:Mitochondrial ribosomal protein S27 (Predicted), isoform CRA_f n=1 Tax=Rattus norvegicus TaxID=10116 RepID=A6I564_RAT|nr:mitochondrial ribosomal protein S27 (predicted), isoform CRA_f [Rattus norvegicus]
MDLHHLHLVFCVFGAQDGEERGRQANSTVRGSVCMTRFGFKWALGCSLFWTKYRNM